MGRVPAPCGFHLGASWAAPKSNPGQTAGLAGLLGTACLLPGAAVVCLILRGGKPLEPRGCTALTLFPGVLVAFLAAGDKERAVLGGQRCYAVRMAGFCRLMATERSKAEQCVASSTTCLSGSRFRAV